MKLIAELGENIAYSIGCLTLRFSDRKLFDDVNIKFTKGNTLWFNRR